MEICGRDVCTGCTACMLVCPQKCITITTDEIGHFFPSVDDDRCIHCGKCKRICHGLNEVSRNRPVKTYAAISKDKQDQISSASGGVASVISKYIIDTGGVVYGCTGNQGYDICHIRVDKADELWKLKGSKYVESRMGDTFKNISADLEAGRTVMFIGTPCQNAGANSLFGNNDSFISVDLICHGVPPQKLLKEHLESKLRDTPDTVSFRQVSGAAFDIYKNNKKIYHKPQLLDLYFTGFYNNLFFRESCYNCKYADEKRCSDITIGDFWGLKDSQLKKESGGNGISVILINTKKGKDIFEKCSVMMKTEERSVEEAVNGNPQLRHPSCKHKNTDQFRSAYSRFGFKKAAGRYLIINRVKYLMLYLYQKTISIITRG